ncbi:glycosyltransferase family 4 protein [Micromonospora zamorensis]|uniref:glycosyltransferase family 4 protein n=1 Tax=Micromonospora zamorensis TaxID=709883 RepID=UPI002E1717E1|nr:glycosyltransferase family 4 protein [Micromonospora zamorensis]WTE89608.1 glycosyltransferase family 4 protein [Micromonospora zamorensis]
MSRPVRVTLVSPLPPPQGGIARWTRMIDGVARGSAEVDLAVVDIALRGRSIHQTSVLRRLVAGGIQLVRSAALLCWRMLRRRPDVVHVNTSGHLGTVRDLVLLAVCRVFRVPFVYHLRFGRVPEIAARDSREWRLMWRVIRAAAAVIALDARTEQAIAARGGSSVVRIANCVDLSGLPRAQPADAHPRRRVLFAGWVIPAKGVEDLLAAWQLVGDPGWELVIAGPCEEGYLRQLRDAVPAGSAVSFLGELSGTELLRLMAVCEIFVLPSHSEGFPNAILEAMALGRAVVGTDVGAVGDMLSGGCGEVVPPADPRRLAIALATLMTSEGRRAEVGDRARAKAIEEYSLAVVFARYVELWRSVSGHDRVTGGPSRKRVADPA